MFLLREALLKPPLQKLNFPIFFECLIEHLEGFLSEDYQLFLHYLYLLQVKGLALQGLLGLLFEFLHFHAHSLEMVSIRKEKLGFVVLDYPLHLRVQFLDVAVELGMTLEDLGLIRILLFLGEEQSGGLVGMG